VKNPSVSALSFSFSPFTGINLLPALDEAIHRPSSGNS